jgi:hypothetical protein
MYLPMFKLENRPLTISLGPFYKKMCSEATRKTNFVYYFGAFGHSQIDPKTKHKNTKTQKHKPASGPDVSPSF